LVDFTRENAAVVSIADEKLKPTRRPARRLVLHGVEVAAWLVFYVAVRALVG
jgi:hypothetical protein